MEADDAIHATLRDLAGATSEHPRLLEVIARQLAELVDGFCAVGLISAEWLDAKLCLFQGRVTTAKAYLGFAPVTSIF